MLAVSDEDRGWVVLTITALTAVGVGAYLPWIRPNPNIPGNGDRVPDILLPEMNAGIEGYSFLLVIVVVIVLLSLVFGANSQYQSVVVSFAGVVSIVVPVYYLATTSLVGFDSTFVPTYGWYVTIGGGVLLAISGLVRFDPSTITE